MISYYRMCSRSLACPQSIKEDECARFCAFEGGCGKTQYGACKRVSCNACATQQFWDCGNKVKAPCAKCAPGVDAFTNTIAVVNSAIKKLSKVMHTHSHSLTHSLTHSLSHTHAVPGDSADQALCLPLSRARARSPSLSHTHMLSQVTPLAKLSPLAATGTLYRGLNGMAFSKRFLFFYYIISLSSHRLFCYSIISVS